ncbi:MAG: hypothetical protein PWQ16_303 [bacterium]|nr:hypothetical protein [bacterium]
MGPFDEEIKGIAIALNPSLLSIRYALENGFNFLLTHHPLLFSGLKKVDISTSIGQVISLAVSGRVTIYSLHTPWDSAVGGGNDYWADLLGLKNRLPLLPIREDPKAGIGRVGEIDGSSFYDVVSFLRKEVNFLIPVFSGRERIYKIAVCTGSGGDLLERTISMGVDLYITADLKYHQVLNARDAGLNLIVLSHHEMEEKTLSYLKDRVKKLFSGLKLEVLREEDPFSR